MNLIGSQLFGNLILLITAILAFSIGWRQITLNDAVELYAIINIKETVNIDSGNKSSSPIISIQNVGTRLIYLDKYIFNGSEYKINGQILPPTYSQANGAYWIDLPAGKEVPHVSLVIYYHDLDDRYWKSEVVADFTNSAWKASSLPRTKQ